MEHQASHWNINRWDEKILGVRRKGGETDPEEMGGARLLLVHEDNRYYYDKDKYNNVRVCICIICTPLSLFRSRGHSRRHSSPLSKCSD
jgi:hypothetical protein